MTVDQYFALIIAIGASGCFFLAGCCGAHVLTRNWERGWYGFLFVALVMLGLFILAPALKIFGVLN